MTKEVVHHYITTFMLYVKLIRAHCFDILFRLFFFHFEWSKFTDQQEKKVKISTRYFLQTINEFMWLFIIYYFYIFTFLIQILIKDDKKSRNAQIFFSKTSELVLL